MDTAETVVSLEIDLLVPYSRLRVVLIVMRGVMNDFPKIHQNIKKILWRYGE
jgi:hypothetical protein